MGDRQTYFEDLMVFFKRPLYSFHIDFLNPCLRLQVLKIVGTIMFSCLVLWSTLQVTRSKILSKMWTWDSPGADLWINMVLLTDLGCNFKYDQTFPQWSSTFVILHMKGKPMVFGFIIVHQETIISQLFSSDISIFALAVIHWSLLQT